MYREIDLYLANIVCGKILYGNIFFYGLVKL